MDELLMKIDDLSGSEYDQLVIECNKFLSFYSISKGYDSSIIDVPGVVNSSLLAFKDRYTGNTKASTFFYVILTRRFTKEYVREVKRRNREILVPMDDHINTRDLVHTDDKKDIEKYIMEMKSISDKVKEVLILISRGYNCSDIAKQKGISRQAVNQMLLRLRTNKEIRKLLLKEKWSDVKRNDLRKINKRCRVNYE